MRPTNLLSALFLVGALSSVSGAASARAPREIVVASDRIRLGDVVPTADGTTLDADVGPAPGAGATRLLTKSDIVTALRDKSIPVPAALPDSVRIVRKTKHLAPWDVNAIVRTALASTPMHRGVVLAVVRAEHPMDVADGWTRVEAEVPRAPKKAGGFSTAATVSFIGANDAVLARAMIPVELAVSEEGTTYDTPRGSAVTLVIRRSLVEVRVQGVTNADGDVGDPVPVQVKMSGRVMQARLLGGDEALALEQPR